MNTVSAEPWQELVNSIYLVSAICFMLFLPLGQYFQWSGLVRQKHRSPSLSLLLCLIGLAAVASYCLGWWVSHAFTTGPGITGGVGDLTNAWPWSDAMAPHRSQSGANAGLLHWFVFFLKSAFVALLVAGPMLERSKGGAILLLGLVAAGVFYPIASAWLWSPLSWAVKLVGFHDAFGAASIHTLAGGFALGTLVCLKSRIAVHDVENKANLLPPPMPATAASGGILITFGLLGLSLSTLSFGFTANEQNVPVLITTTTFGTATSLGTVLANFAMGLAGGFLAGHAKEAGNLSGTVSGGIAGLVAVAAAADTYHPLQTFLIAAGLATVGLWWRERLALRNGIDDVTGTVALHGIVGFLGLALSGVILWTYPASPGPDFSRINPFGQILGAIFAFGLFGFLPGYLFSRFLRFLGLLQEPILLELAGESLVDSLQKFGIQRKALDREISAAKLAESRGGR
jgi:ammonium transporter, Amt family